MKNILVLMALSLLVVSCSGRKKDAKDFEHALEAATGQDQVIEKLKGPVSRP